MKFHLYKIFYGKEKKKVVSLREFGRVGGKIYWEKS